jgi:hypothetical protein
MASSQSSVALSGLVEEDGYNVCVCDGCEFVETAFVNNGGAYYKNDKKSFIKSKVFSSDTIEFTLWKNGVQVAALNASTYGTFYNFGSPLLINANYKGMLVDWNLVQLAFGYGKYKVRTVHTSLGTPYTSDSWEFEVVEYNDFRADGTFRMETYQNGAIEGGFDYSGINWYQSLRISGKLGNKQVELIETNYQKTNREKVQIQAEVENTWTLNTELLPAVVYNIINEDAILANKVQITDYNLKNQEIYRRLNVYFSNIKDQEMHNFTRKGDFVYELKLKRGNKRKRNISGDFGTLPTQPNSSTTVSPTTLYLYASWAVGVSENEFTMPAGSGGEYTSITESGGNGSITIKVNAGAFAAFSSPLILVDGDVVTFKRTISTGAGNAYLQGQVI